MSGRLCVIDRWCASRRLKSNVTPAPKGKKNRAGSIWKGQIIEVNEVLDRWYQVESRPEWPRADYFKVRAADEREYLLKHDLESDEWFLGQQW